MSLGSLNPSSSREVVDLVSGVGPDMSVRSELVPGSGVGTAGASMSTSGYMYGLSGRSAASQSHPRRVPAAQYPAAFLPPNDQLQIALAFGMGLRFHGPGELPRPVFPGVTGNLALLSVR